MRYIISLNSAHKLVCQTMRRRSYPLVITCSQDHLKACGSVLTQHVQDVIPSSIHCGANSTPLLAQPAMRAIARYFHLLYVVLVGKCIWLGDRILMVGCFLK